MSKQYYTLLLSGLMLFGLMPTASAQVIHIQEDFSSASGSTPPAGWTNQLVPDSAGGLPSQLWSFSNPASRSLGTDYDGQGMDSDIAIVDSDNYGSGSTQSAGLITPALDLTNATDTYLEFSHTFRAWSGTIGHVHVSIDSGATWTEVYTTTNFNYPPSSTASTRLNLSTFVDGQDDVMVRFWYFGSWGYYWALDNITLGSKAPLDLSVRSNFNVAKCPTGCDSLSVTLENVGNTLVDFSTDPVKLYYAQSGAATAMDSIVLNTGSLDTASSMTMKFSSCIDVTANGTHNFVVYHNFTDSVSFNDSTSFNYGSGPTVVQTAPYNENFETFSVGFDASGYQNGWTPDPANTTSAYRWNVNSGSTGSANTGPDVDNTTGTTSGNYIYTEASSPASQGDTALLVSPCINLSNLTSNAVLRFAYHFYGDDIDSMEVFVDNGTSRTKIGSLVGEYQFSNTDAWRDTTLNITSFLGQTITVIFKGWRGGSFDGDMSIDDFAVYEQFNDDLLAKSANLVTPFSPSSTICYGSNNSLEFGIENFGSNSIDFSTTNLTISGSISGPINQTFSNRVVNTGTLASGDTAVYAIPGTVDLSAGGTYTVTLIASMTGDQETANDTLVTTIISPNVNNFPFLQDFESFDIGDDGFKEGFVTSTSAGNADDYFWEVESGPSGFGNSGPLTDHTTGTGSGKYVFTETFFGTSNGDSAYMNLPCADFSNDSLAMDFWYHMYGDDIGTLSVELDTGNGWISVWSLSGEQQTTDADPWRFATVDLTPFYGNTANIRFAGTAAGTYDGDIALDDILIRPLSKYDLAGASVNLNAGSICNDPAFPLTIDITNFGKDTIFFSNDSLIGNIQVTDPNGLVTNYPFNNVTDTVGPGDTVTLNVPSVSLVIGGEYTIAGTVSLTSAGDSNILNDGLPASRISIKGVETPTYFKDFDSWTVNYGTAGITDGWTVNPSTGYSWYTEDQNTSSGNTGPTGDFDGTGVYLYTEGSSGSSGDTAFLYTPCIAYGSDTVLRVDFFYHMFGSDMGSLLFQTKDAGVWTTKWSRSGEQQTSDTDDWLRASVSLPGDSNTNVECRFVGVYGTGLQTDMAIDNFNIGPPPSTDVAMVGTTAPSESACGTPSYPLSVVVENQGIAPLDFSSDSLIVEATLTDPLFTTTVLRDTFTTGTLAVGARDTLAIGSVNLLQGGTYTISAFVDLVGPDSIGFNDTLSSSTFDVKGVETPSYFEDFDTWSVQYSTAGFTNGWVTAPTSGYKWHTEDQNTSSGNTGPTGDFDGNGVYIYAEASLGANGDSAFAYTPCFDLSNGSNYVMEFAYYMYGTTMNELAVQVYDSGRWENAFTLVGEQQTSDSEPWRIASINLSEYAGSVREIRFAALKGTSFTGDICIDNVNIYELVNTNAVATDLSTGGSSTCLGASEQILFSIYNQGADTLDFAANNATVTVNISGPNAGTVSTTVSTGTLAPFDTLVVTVANSYNMSVGGTYTLDGAVSYPGDTLNADDSISVDITNYAISNFNTFLGDFEQFSTGSDFSVGWFGTPLASSFDYRWEVEQGTTPSGNTGPSGDHTTGSGNYAAIEASNGSSGDVAYLEMPCVQFTGATPLADISFWYHMYGSDMGTLELEVNPGGAGWTSIWSLTGQQQSASSDPWIQAVVDISTYTSSGLLEVRFKATSAGTIQGDMALDDIEFIIPEANNIQADMMMNPYVTCGMHAKTPLELQVRNVGSQPQDTIFIDGDVDGLWTFSDTAIVSPALQPGDVYTHTVQRPASLANAGQHSISFTAFVTGDTSASNNTLSVDLHKVYLPTDTVTFDGYTGTNLPTAFPGWNEAHSQQNGRLVLSSEWTAGSGSAMLPMDEEQRLAEWIISPSVEPTSTTYFYYEVRADNGIGSAPTYTGNNRLMVRISDDCGATWVDSVIYNDASSLSTSTVRDSIDLSAYQGSEVMVALAAFNAGSPNSDLTFYADNLAILNDTTDDLGAVAILDPASGPEDELSTVVPRVVVKNKSGGSFSNSTTVRMSMDNNLATTFTNLNLAPGEEDTVDFDPITLEVPNYSGTGIIYADICAYTGYAQDVNPQNDSVCSYLVVDAGLVSGVKSVAKSNMGVNVYPNPFKDYIRLEFVGDMESGLFGEVLTVDGKVAKTLEPRSIQGGSIIDVDLSGDLPKGNYILKLRLDDGFIYKELIKE